MADRWIPTDKSAHLRGRSSRDTRPELALRRELHRRGLRYRLHMRLAKHCVPDILFGRARVAVFVDGCFWHGCPLHGRRKPFTGPNAALWTQKLERTKERDRTANELAESLGYRVIRLWECAITKDAGDAASTVENTVTCAGASSANPRP